MNETAEDVERDIKALKRYTAFAAVFLTGVSLGNVVAKIIRSRESRAAKTETV